MATTSAAAPGPTGASPQATPPCDIRGSWSEDESAFVIDVGGRAHRFDVSDGFVEARFRVYNAANGAVFVAVAGGEESRLRAASCAGGALDVVLERAGADFTYAALRADRGALYFTDAGGAAALDLASMTVVPITTTPEPTAAFVDECTEADRMKQSPHARRSPAPPDPADIGFHDRVVRVAPGGELVIRRGADCETGVGEVFAGEELVVTSPGDPARRATRRSHGVASVAADASGALWIGDAGDCSGTQKDTPGAVWRSADGGAHWTRVAVSSEMETAADVVWIDGGRVVVRSIACEDISGAVRGGAVYETRDGGRSWGVVETEAGTGAAGREVVVGGVTYRASWDGLWREAGEGREKVFP